MASLEGVLARIPFLGGYAAQDQQNRMRERGDLQNAGALQGMLEKMQARQQEEEMRGVLAQAGGDPAKAVQALLTAGTPKSIELASKLKGMMPKPAEPYTLAPGAQRMGPNNELLAEAPMRPDKEQAPSNLARLFKEMSALPEGDPQRAAYKDAIIKESQTARQIAPAININAPSKEALSNEAIRDLAIQSLYDSNVLAGYRRDTTAMSRIGNERIKVMKEAGITSEDVVGGRAGFKADTASLNKITPQYDAITAFEKTAIRNGKILIELGDKVDATGVPVIETWIRKGRQATGDPDVAKFNAQLHLYRAEAARILTQPNLSGVLSDSARHEMEDFMKGGASAKQIRGVVNLLERDFNNRKETLEEQIGNIRTRMRGRVGPGAAEGATPPAVAPTTATPAATTSIEDRLKKYK